MCLIPILLPLQSFSSTISFLLPFQILSPSWHLPLYLYSSFLQPQSTPSILHLHHLLSKAKDPHIENPLFLEGVFFGGVCGFFGHITQLAGSKFPNQGLNWAPAVKAPSPNHWTNREFPRRGLSHYHWLPENTLKSYHKCHVSCVCSGAF